MQMPLNVSYLISQFSSLEITFTTREGRKKWIVIENAYDDLIHGPGHPIILNS